MTTDKYPDDLRLDKDYEQMNKTFTNIDIDIKNATDNK